MLHALPDLPPAGWPLSRTPPLPESMLALSSLSTSSAAVGPPVSSAGVFLDLISKRSLTAGGAASGVGGSVPVKTEEPLPPPADTNTFFNIEEFVNPAGLI
eukprot:jgi/Chrzof1/1522/Cz10g11020.t1